MTTLTSFLKTDLVDDHTAADVNKLIAGNLRPEYANTETISATKTLTDNDCQFQFLTASGANRDVRLAPEATTNHITIIYNSGATYSLVVKDDSGGTTFATLAPDEWDIFYPLNAEGWKTKPGTFASSAEVLTGTETAKAVSPDTLNDVVTRMPWDGQMLNGKIDVTVASNNITVKILTWAGANPSASDPVYVRINGTIRTITAALSVTKNAGTNWFASGTTAAAGVPGLATKEIDYFVYLGYNSTDGVVIGFARIPWASAYGDFSTTSTNEKYCAISNITTAASTDYYFVVGRFAATLSATASFNWSVPAFTADNLKQYPIYETRWLAWTPFHSRTGGAYTNVPTVNNAKYKIKMRLMDYVEDHTQNATPGSSGNQTMTLPFASSSNHTGTGYNNNTAICIMPLTTAGLVTVWKYDGTAEATASQRYYLNGANIEL